MAFVCFFEAFLKTQLWTYTHRHTHLFVFVLSDRMREVDLGSGKALLIKEHGEFSAMGHKCPHYGAPLVKGECYLRIWTMSIHLSCCVTFDLRVAFWPSRCAVKRTRALSVARRVFQHCDRRHRGLPWTGQSADLPGDLPRSCSHTFPDIFSVSKHRQKVYTSFMSVWSRSELKRTRWSFAQTSR